MTTLQSRVRDYLDSRKPKLTSTIASTQTELEVAVSELQTAWDEFIDPFRSILKLIKYAIYTLLVLTVLAAISIVGIVNKCYLDSRCSVEIDRVNR